jgi:L-aspartate oxidase
VLIDEKGERFMADFERAELEPRDIVSRAIWAHMTKTHKVFLDSRKSIGETFAEKFPAIHAVCLSAGIDPVQAPIPVRPAAHYHMGGVAVDAEGRSSVNGLWACGEVASTGLHGANRLASNSLLEAAFFGARVAEDIKGVSVRHSAFREKKIQISNLEPRIREKIRNIMSAHLGVLRNGQGLETAIRELAPLAEKSDMALAGLMIAVAAATREESRGSHARLDYPDPSSAWAQRQILTLASIESYAQALIRDVPLAAAGA